MRIKALLTSILLASTTIAGVASASPIVRDHRDQPAVTYQAPVRYQNQTRVQARPSWMVKANVNYGFQLDADGDSVQPYTYGNDPYAEGIARSEWTTLNPCLDISGRNAPSVDLGGRAVRSVEYQATKGSAYIYEVAVMFKDGHQQAFMVNRTVDATHEPNLRIDLGAQGMAGVRTVVLEGSGHSSFRLIGA